MKRFWQKLVAAWASMARTGRGRRPAPAACQSVGGQVPAVAGNGQMLLPGIADPYRWDFAGRVPFRNKVEP